MKRKGLPAAAGPIRPSGNPGGHSREPARSRPATRGRAYSATGSSSVSFTSSITM